MTESIATWKALQFDRVVYSPPLKRTALNSSKKACPGKFKTKTNREDSLSRCNEAAYACIDDAFVVSGTSTNGLRSCARFQTQAQDLLISARDALKMANNKPHQVGLLGIGASNAVFQARSLLWKDPFDELRTGLVSWNDSVIRITRSGCERERGYILKELTYLLYAAVEGYGLPCTAAIAYQECRNSQKWGLMIVYPKAQDLNSGVVREGNSIQQAKFLFDSVQKAVYAQAKVGALQIDSKPGNFVCTPDRRCWAIDFDPDMFTIDHRESSSVLMLVSLTFFAAHIRAYYLQSVADYFASFAKPVMRKLLKDISPSHWCLTTKAKKQKFEFGSCSTPNEIALRMQSVATAYFGDVAMKTAHSFMKLDESTSQKSLLLHMLDFAL